MGTMENIYIMTKNNLNEKKIIITQKGKSISFNLNQKRIINIQETISFGKTIDNLVKN